MNSKTLWYRFAYLAVLILAPYFLIWVLPGTFYPVSYFRALDLIKLGDRHQDVTEEIEGIKLFQTIFTEQCSANVLLGDLYTMNHQPDMAVNVYHQAWQDGCLTESGMLNLVQLEKEDPDQLESDLTRWIAQHPKAQNQIYRALIGIYEMDSRFDEAAALSESWVQHTPDQSAAWESLFSYGIYFPVEIMRDYAANLPALNTEVNSEVQRIVDAYILSFGEDEDVVTYRLGVAYSSIGQWAKAEECFQKSIAVEPDRTESWINLAIAQKNQGKESYNAISEAEMRAGDSDTIRSLMGIYYRETNPEIAYVYWMKLISSQPDVPEWLLEGSNALAQMGDLEEAEVLLQRAVILAPDRMDVLAAYAQFCLMYNIDLSTTGLEQTRAMIKLQPENPFGYILEGQILFATGDYLTAERMFVKALELENDAGAANYYLGLLYREMDEPAKAWQYLQTASQSSDEYYQQAAAHLLDSY